MAPTRSKPTPTPKARGKEPVRFPDIEVVRHLEGPQGDKPPLTYEDAEQMLGWTEEPPGANWGDDFILVDTLGKKVRLENNHGNRHFNASWARELALSLLNRYWADSRNGEGRTVNGESIIFGQSGKVLSAQHRLVGLKLASQEWEKQPHWKAIHPDGPPTMEAIVVYGVSELDEVVRTLDNTRPRTVADVLYTNHKLFGKAKQTERASLTKVLESAIKELWDRTGAVNDPFSTFGNTEAVNFLERHPRVSQAVKHIWDVHRGQDKKGQLLKFFCRPGTAAALLYLMGSSASDPTKYEGADLHKRGDKQLSWSEWEKAKTFWSDLASNRLLIVRQAIASLSGPEGDYLVLNSHKIAVLVKAWVHYRDGAKLTLNRITPELTDPDKAGKRTLLESVECGGIDLGSSTDRRIAAKGEKANQNGETEEEPAEESQLTEDSPEEEGVEHEEESEELEEEVQEDSQEEEEVEETNGEYLVEDSPDPVEEEEEGPEPDDPSPLEIEEGTQQARSAREEKKAQQRAKLLSDRDRRRK